MSARIVGELANDCNKDQSFDRSFGAIDGLAVQSLVVYGLKSVCLYSGTKERNQNHCLRYKTVSFSVKTEERHPGNAYGTFSLLMPLRNRREAVCTNRKSVGYNLGL